MAAAASSSSPESRLLPALAARGWCLRDVDRIPELAAQLSTSATVDSLESELLNMDLRSIGGKCLPQPSLFCKTSHLQGPIVLQVCSSRDISRSSMAEASEHSSNRRLLRLKLTDGHSEITAVEYSHVPSIPDDISPGTKVRLQSKADVRSGILCLNKKVITVLGGVVQSLYEEWQLKRKYLNVPRFKEDASNRPPPFEKLQVQAPRRGTSSTSYTSSTEKVHFSVDTTGTSSIDHRKSLAAKGEGSSLSQTVQLQKNNATTDGLKDKLKLPHTIGENPEKATASLERPKVTASVPVQNQVAAQKLLQKTSQPNFSDRNSRFQRRRGKDKDEDDSSLITLEEWERRKTGTNLQTTHEHSHSSRDEDLARQLQEQFDLEDNHVQNDSHQTDARSIKMSMFNFERDDNRTSGRAEFRGRGRGRGRGRRI